MQEQELPTKQEMFRRALMCVDEAYASLGDASDWLRSDWRPLGSALSDEQGHARSAVFDQIGQAKNQLNEIKLRLNAAAE